MSARGDDSLLGVFSSRGDPPLLVFPKGSLQVDSDVIVSPNAHGTRKLGSL